MDFQSLLGNGTHMASGNNVTGDLRKTEEVTSWAKMDTHIHNIYISHMYSPCTYQLVLYVDMWCFCFLAQQATGGCARRHLKHGARLLVFCRLAVECSMPETQSMERGCFIKTSCSALHSEVAGCSALLELLETVGGRSALPELHEAAEDMKRCMAPWGKLLDNVRLGSFA